MKGRKKIPDELKSLRGTDQPCRMTGNAVPAGTAVATLPRSGLKGTAKKVFEVVATELIHKCLLDVVGADLVVAYAREMGLYHDMMRETEKEGYTIEVVTKHGTATVVNPKRKVAESALANAKITVITDILKVVTNDTKITTNVDFAEFEEIK